MSFSWFSNRRRRVVKLFAKYLSFTFPLHKSRIVAEQPADRKWSIAWSVQVCHSLGSVIAEDGLLKVSAKYLSFTFPLHKSRIVAEPPADMKWSIAWSVKVWHSLGPVIAEDGLLKCLPSISASRFLCRNHA